VLPCALGWTSISKGARCTAVVVGNRNVVRLVGDASVFELLTTVSDCTDQKPDH
jgi:hypothetical protein